MIKPEVLDAMVAAGCTAEQIAAAVKADQAVSSTNAERQARYRARGGGKISPEMRLAVFDRDGFMCLECGTSDNLCCDHAVPVSKGGETTLENLQTLCIPCNSRKKDRIRKYERRHARTSSDNSADITDKVSPKKEIPPTPPKEKTTPSNLPSESAREFDEFWGLFPNKVGKRDAEKAFVTARKRDTFEAILAGVRRYAAKTDDRPWCNPTTFLNQDRWKDQPATQAQAPPKPRNVGELSRDQLLSPRTEIDVTNYSARRLDTGDGRRLSQGTGDAKPFAITGNEFGRI